MWGRNDVAKALGLLVYFGLLMLYINLVVK